LVRFGGVSAIVTLSREVLFEGWTQYANREIPNETYTTLAF
jgi:hypothetical protein